MAGNSKLVIMRAIAVNQGGRRAGAVTVSLDVWHLDLPEFLEIQTENGDGRRKAYDVFPQLVISDAATPIFIKSAIYLKTSVTIAPQHRWN